MQVHYFLSYYLLQILLQFTVLPVSSEKVKFLAPKIHVAITVSNKERWLPFTLSCFESLEYPKDRLSVHFYSDHNLDNSIQSIETWIQNNVGRYKSLELTKNTTIPAAKPSWDHPERHHRILKLRQAGLVDARNKWADFYIYLDCDIFLMEKSALTKLLSDSYESWIVKAPLLTSSTLFSNFWGAQNSETGYYERSDDYERIYSREIVGNHPVPVVHSCVIVDLRKTASSQVQFYPVKPGYTYTFDESLVMAHNMRVVGIVPVLDNNYNYGRIMTDDESQDDYVKLSFALEEILTDQPVGFGVDIKPVLSVEHIFPTTLDDFGFDKIFCINLKRRPDRRERMEKVFQIHGLGPIEYPGAVDGQKITQQYLDENGIAPLVVLKTHIMAAL